MKLYWTKEALIRLQEIEDYISRDNPRIAIEFVDKIVSISETIPSNPEKGRILTAIERSEKYYSKIIEQYII